MSSIEEKLKLWSADDTLIMCIRVALDRSDAACELCGAWIAALPESRNKAQQPGWHLICRECVAHVRTRGDLKFKGRYKTSEEAATTFSTPYQVEAKK